MPSIQPTAGTAGTQRAQAASPRHPLRTVLRLFVTLLLAVSSLLVIAWLTLHWGILPRIEQWRPQLEERAGRSLGVAVRIGRIEVRSSGWVPSFELRDVALLDAQGRSALQLPRVTAAVSPRSLLSFELRFAQLLIEGAQLEVRRDAAGRVFVAGLEVTGAGADDGALRDWFFDQHEFVIRGGRLRWTDEQRDAPPLALTDVQLALRNGVLQHELRLDATPEPAWGERFSLRGRFRQPLLARSGDWRQWSGAAFADLPRVDVRELRRYVSLPFEIGEGDGALRAWVDVADGQPRSATVDLALRAVALRLAPEVEPLAFEQVEGRLIAQRDAEGVRIDLQRFGFVTGDGVRWPAGDLSLAWRGRAGEPASGGELRAQRLDLEVMAQIATRVPLGDALRRLLAELEPQGIVSDLSASWQGPVDAPTRYQAKAALDGLALTARPAAEAGGIGRPGLRNATLQIALDQAGGQAQLAIKDGTLDFPGVFEQPELAMEALAARLSWTIAAAPAGGAPAVVLRVEDASFANADAQGTFSGSWRTGPGAGFARGARLPGRLELDGRITRADATQVARYLPLGIPAAPRRYVADAVRGGTLRDASVRVNGDLWDFPFYGARTAKDGEFHVAGRVEDVTLAYVPSVPARDDRPAWVSPWPAFTGVRGELVFDRASLEIRVAQAQLGDIVLSQVQGGIRNLAENSVLSLDGSARGPLAQMLSFVHATPVGRWIGGALANASGAGTAELRLGLAIPLDDVERSTAKGSLVLAGNDLRITPESPALGAARGRIDFTHKDFTVSAASARLLGGEASFEGGMRGDGSVLFSGQGSLGAEGLRRLGGAGLAARLGEALSGQTSYRASVAFTHGVPEVSITSDLVGLAIDLPPPLRKAAEAPLPLRFQTSVAAEAAATPGAAPTRDTLRIELGTVLAVQYERDLSGTTPRVLRGGIGVFEPAPTPSVGVLANVNLGVLHVDAWENALSRLLGDGGAAPQSDAGYMPTHIALRAQELHSGARRFSSVVAGISREDSLWRANVEAEQLSGYVEYRPAAGPAQTAGLVYARLARLSLPKSDVDEVETLLDQQPTSTVPGLDIVVDDFELRGKRLGRLQIEAVNRVAGEGRDALREWQLARFSLGMPEAQLSGSGHWTEVGGSFMTVPGAAASARRRAVLDFRLDVADAGALLGRLGTGRTVRGGKGQLSGQVSWLGSPLTLDYPTLSGQVNVAIDAGQFLKAEPGAARLLSVLSLQSLPRRLVLDFRDVFQEGFAFDNITGDLVIEQGVARTNNLRMRGVQAVVLMEGQADLARETQDLRVIVVPEINAGTASLAYAAINPAVGIGTFLAQVFLRRPLIQAGTREFRVSGSWDDPKVEKVERSFGDAVPDVDAAASAPAPASAPRPRQ